MWFSSTSVEESIVYKGAGFIKLCFLIFAFFLLSACSVSRYSMERDAAPSGDFDASKVPDAVPFWEPISPKGNQSPYFVAGEEYYVLPSSEGYSEEGVASWYGLKFHGELTSNGEIYNMYGMTAAHKSLPLPSFVSVTNLENNISIVVRVNDRGPFHEGRIIDLSYAAAKKLDVVRTGTAKVLVKAIATKPPLDKKGVSEKNELAFFIQVAALSTSKKAEDLVTKIRNMRLGYESFVSVSPNGTYRVRIGPFSEELRANAILDRLVNAKLGSPIVIKRSVAARGS